LDALLVTVTVPL
jgi:hypothetical protein